MTVLAKCRRRDVPDGLGGRSHGSDARVTAIAGRVTDLEDSARMAAFTADVGMRALEVEAGAEVVKRFLGARDGCRQQ